MKLKIVFIIILLVLLVVSISQIFSIPPYSDEIFETYKSGYFHEIDREFDIIIDSFLGIKMMSKPVYAWIFLEDIRQKYNYEISVFNYRGQEVRVPGETEGSENSDVLKIINSMKPQAVSRIENNKYYAAIPVFKENKCGFCHKINNKSIAGVLTFKRNYDSYIYYSSERIIIFSVISLTLLLLLFFAIRWEPAKTVNRLFNE